MSTSILFVRALVEALEQCGVPRERVFRAAPFDPARLEALDERVELEELDALYDLALTLTGDDAFGLTMGGLEAVGNFNLSAHLVAHAGTLREGALSLFQFHQLLADTPCWHLDEDGATATLRYQAAPGPARARRVRAELTMLGFQRMLRYFDRNARPRAVAFDYPAPAYRAAYTRAFEGAERFGQPFIGLVFDRPLLEAVQLHRDPELHALVVARAEQRVHATSPGYASLVRRHVLEHGASSRHDMNGVARALGLSARSLRRRLHEEGTSFREIVDAALGTLATRLIADRARPIEAAAYEMGFSHPSAFHRAFKRWTGETPSALRARAASETRPLTARGIL